MFRGKEAELCFLLHPYSPSISCPSCNPMLCKNPLPLFPKQILSHVCHSPLGLRFRLLLLPFGLRLSFISIRTRFPFPFLRSFRACVFRTRFSTIRQRFTITLVSSSRYIVI